VSVGRRARRIADVAGNYGRGTASPADVVPRNFGNEVGVLVRPEGAA
jgi:hypothetical protein